jgi:hypothetical protein
MSNEKPPFMRLTGWLKREGANCGLHPLIYTFPSEISAQDVGKKKAEPKTPHFLSSNQNIVAWSQEAKCRLKYVIHIQSGQRGP